MEDRIARVFSILFHPLFMPFYMLLVLFSLDSWFALLIPVKLKLLLSGLVLVTTILFPGLVVFLLFRMKLVKSLTLESREERIYPLLAAAVFYYLTYYLLKGFSIAFLFSYCMLGSTFLTILALIITFYRKISLHMLGAGGLTGFLMGLSLSREIDLTLYILPAILLAGILGFARLKSKSHKPSEIYCGFLVGGGVMFLLFIFL